MDKLYGEIGKKIKRLAYYTFIGEAVAAVLGGLVALVYMIGVAGFFGFIIGLLVGAIVAIVGVIAAWVSSWLLYGFGELIDKTCDIEKNTSDIRRNIIYIKKDACDIEKNTRNGQSKKQIEESINVAEAEAEKTAAEKRAAQEEAAQNIAKEKAAAAEKYAEEIISPVNLENGQLASDFMKNASGKFVRVIVFADKSENNKEAREYLEAALNYLTDPAELYIVKALLKLSKEEMQARLKELRQKCDK